MRVDFYLLTENKAEDSWLIACRLIEKAYFKGHRIFVFFDEQQDAERLDELLWTFRDDSFVPHNLLGEGPEPPPPVQIGWEKEPRGHQDILINFSKSIPNFHQRFKRVIEIVPNEEEAKNHSRAHYRQYRSMAYDLHTHDIN
jgi:DNA polymerase-3 subunit chi